MSCHIRLFNYASDLLKFRVSRTNLEQKINLLIKEKVSDFVIKFKVSVMNGNTVPKYKMQTVRIIFKMKSGRTKTQSVLYIYI